MEKKKMAKALMMTAILAGGFMAVQSFFNEVNASDCYNLDTKMSYYQGSYHYSCSGSGTTCRLAAIPQQ